MQSRFKPNPGVLDPFIKWIERFDIRHAKAWGLQYNNDPEAAMCEATFWGVLQDCNVDVEPCDSLTGEESSPDFKCHKNGETFYVEVTCLQIESVTNKTSLSHEAKDGAQFYTNLNSAIFEKIRRKTPQCSDLDAPALVAIGTFHFEASCLCVRKDNVEELLTGEQMISGRIDSQTGGAVGKPYISTRLKDAAFYKPQKSSGFKDARLPVSGVLIGGFGCEPPRVYGCLHPNAIREFNRQLLDRIEFCQLKVDDTDNGFITEWI
ncbi:MAG: hypothetical protein JW849_02380 [Phycisphaerae bacterium]|nr:hypothetical protein [Phycisphaerae bacterium]